MATFVLVHGSWAGSVVWRELAPRLRKAGHDVYAPTLTGIGARKHLLSREIDLNTHIQDVIGVIDDADLSDIVLVGNSYGGMVISGVADRLPEKVASLIYLDAFVPENGQSLLSLLPPDLRLATVPGEDWLVSPPTSAASLSFSSTFRPSASNTFSRGLQLRKTATRKPNVTFIAFPLGERQRVLEFPVRIRSTQTNAGSPNRTRGGAARPNARVFCRRRPLGARPL